MAFDLRQKVFRVPDTLAVSVGLRWDFIGADPVDLDLSAVCFTAEGKLLDVVFFNHPFPLGTDERSLRSSGLLVDLQQLPYMFVSGDSRIGGEEENQLPGIALAARRRKYQMLNGTDRDNGRSGWNRKHGDMKQMGITEAIFSRLYGEDELDEVQESLDVKRGRGRLFDEEGRPLRRKPFREFCDEWLTFVMHKIPNETHVIFIVVTSYTGADFTTLPSAKLVVFNEMANECVGTIDLKYSTGNGTANLACMLCRLPPSSGRGPSHEHMEPQLWDLRELNLRTFGYTFVDVLPLMMDVLGVEKNSRDDAVRLLPDYSLAKEVQSHTGHLLSDVRFGVGWYGEHDLDAFMLLLDANNCCVDILHPKQSRLNSLAPHAARHSGDAINGFGTLGDTEFIDLVTYRIPLEVQTILFGASYVESFGDAARHTKSIFDVPRLYMRLQNRTLGQPNSFEVDRWSIHSEVEEEKAGLSAARKNTGDANRREEEARTPRMFVGPDGKKYPVRMVVLGLMVKYEEVPFSLVYPDGRLDQQQFLQNSPQTGEKGKTGSNEREDLAEDMVPVFEYRPLHEYTPASNADSFSSVIPYLYCIAECRGGGVSTATLHRTDRTNDMHPSPNSHHNPLEWRPSLVPVCPPSLWKMMASSAMLMHYAVQVRFLEVRNLQPTLPHRFRCHGEAWVCNRLPSAGRPLTVFDTQLFRTPSLMHRECTLWNEKNTTAAALFLVRTFDRIRVVIYECASCGFVDIDLMHMNELWQPPPLTAGEGATMDDGRNEPRRIERWFPLTGTPPTTGEVRLRLSRVPLKAAVAAQTKVVAEKNKAYQQHKQRVLERKEKQIRRDYSNACTVM